jgi:glycosyltransferase involved in cell wall biosynthesis
VIVRKLLCVLSNLEYGSVAAQFVQLLLALPGSEFQKRVCVMGRSGPWAEKLRQAGVEVDAPGRGRLFDLKPLVTLRGLIGGYSPDVVHVWGRAALRSFAVSGFKGKLVVSPCLRPDYQRSWLKRLDRWLLRRASHVVAFGETDAGRCRAFGISDKLVIVRPAVKLEEGAALARPHRYIVCIGRLEAYKGFLDALWAHDILRHVYPDLYLIIAGAGPERERLRRFMVGMESTNRVEMPGAVTETASLLRQAELVWSPGRSETGTQVVLEAMAAGKPVIASDHPRLAELIVEGETGFLVPAEDKAALARQTHSILSDPALAERMGEAGRQRVAQHFTPEALAEVLARVYKE